MKKLLYAILLHVVLCGCSAGKEKGTKVFLRSYVMYYYDIEEVRLKSLYKEAVEYKDNAIIIINLTVGNRIGAYNDSEATRERYDALCEKHDDLTYNRNVLLYSFSQRVEYQAVDFVSIDIKSNADYDERHLAGTSLADIITFNSYSAKPYIDSGYVEYDWGYDMGKQGFYPIDKPLTEVSENDMVLLGTGSTGYDPIMRKHLSYGGVLIFDKDPTLSKTHNFTVTMKADDGRTFAASVDMQFE